MVDCTWHVHVAIVFIIHQITNFEIGMQKGTTINWYRHVTELYFAMSEIDIKSPVGSTVVGVWKKFWFFHPQDCWKMHLSKQGKYPIVNKSTTFAFFCYPYLKPLHIFLQETQQWKVPKFLFLFLFFPRKIRILVKTRKITYLLTEQALPQFEKGDFHSRVRKSLII